MTSGDKTHVRDDYNRKAASLYGQINFKYKDGVS